MDELGVWPHGFTRFWAVYDGKTLVCVCVYKKGAVEVVRRLREAQRKAVVNG